MQECDCILLLSSQRDEDETQMYGNLVVVKMIRFHQLLADGMGFGLTATWLAFLDWPIHLLVSSCPLVF